MGTERDALTRWRWWRRPSTTTWCNATTPTTGGAIPPTPPTTSLSRRRTARRTTWSSAGLRWRRSARTTPAATPPTPSAPRSLGSCVPLLAVASRRELRSALTRCRPWSRTPPRSSVALSPRGLAACDQAGSQAGAHRGMRGRAQGGLHQVEDQPQEGQEARRQEVVLRPLRGVRPGLDQQKTQYMKPRDFPLENCPSRPTRPMLSFTYPSLCDTELNNARRKLKD